MSRLTVFLLASSLAAQDAALRNPRTSPEDVSAGAKTFRSHCAECHGLNGEGGRGPNLAGGVYYHGGTDADLLRNISDGISGTEMPGLFYSPDRVWQIVAYLRSLNEGSQGAVSGDRRAGEALYRSSGCRDCHRIGDDGGRTGPNLSHIARTRSAEHLRQAIVEPSADVRERYWVVEFAAPDGKVMSGYVMNEDTYTVQFMDFSGAIYSFAKAGAKNYRIDKTSKMPSYKDRFSKQQLDDLVAYLASLRPEVVTRNAASNR